MLLEFTCSNHISIRKQVLFSTLAGRDTSNMEKVENIAGLRVLKSAVIYGANGSGKSNFINAISFIKNLVLNSINYQPGQGMPQTPHKLEGFHKISTYQIQFIANGIRYTFGVSLKEMIVTEEYLYYFPNGKQTKIFERKDETFSAGSKFRGKFSVCKDVLKPNRLLLSCAANFSSVEEVTWAFKFFSDALIIYNPGHQDDSWLNYSLNQIHNSAKIKQAVLDFFKELNTGIKDINITIDKAQIDSSMLPPFLSDEFKKMLINEKVNAISTKIVYDKFETDLIAEESTGIKKLFSMLCPILDVLANGKVLICDELEAGLHEALVYELVKLFISTHTEHPAQLIFTTHETGLLNLDLFRRDQIWFTEMKAEDRSTDLFSLAEIRNVRRTENIQKGYIAGKYGGIPMLNIDFAKIVENYK